MSNGGSVAQRGFIFQSLIAMIECLDRDDWDEIKMEPTTELDKVDFVLRRNGAILSAIQVKSSKYAFGCKSVKGWLEKLKADSPGAEEYHLYLVGNLFTDDCEVYIKKHRKEIEKVSFKNLQETCTGHLAKYVGRVGFGKDVTVDDLDLIDDSLFAKIHKNSIVGKPMSHTDFETAFQRAIPVKKVDKNQPPLPSILKKARSPVEPFIEGVVRTEDLSNINLLLTQSQKPLLLHGEGGIGKTEVALLFAKTHPEYEFIFTTFSGSINQTLSQNLFDLPDYKCHGLELDDEKRYDKNYFVFRQYSEHLKRVNRNLVLIIDDYNPQENKNESLEQIEQILQNSFTGNDNDLKEIDKLMNTGIRIILITRKKPQYSDIYTTYEIKNMGDDDLLEVMTSCFTKILPHFDDADVRDKLLRLLRISGYGTVYVTIMAWAMQNSEKEPIEALNTMLQTLDSDVTYATKYSNARLQMQGHIEKVLRFIGLSYQERQVLTTLSMLPDEGMEYKLYQKLTATNAQQLDQLRKQALMRFINNRIVIPDYQQKENNAGEHTFLLRMHPIVADHAHKMLAGKDPTVFYNSVKMNWINKIVHYFDDETLKHLKISDNDYRYVSLLIIACSAAEQKLKRIGACFKCPSKELLASRELLLLTASDMSDKIGNIKDALEYIERAIAVDGPSSKSLQVLFNRSLSVGARLLRGEKYPEAKQYFLNCLQILNDRNCIVVKDIDCPAFYNSDLLAVLEDSNYYSSIFNWIGGFYSEQGNCRKALEYYEKALSIQERVLGSDHPDVATVYNNIGTVYRDIGNYKKALEYYTKALSIRERVLGSEHLDVAISYGNLADVYVHLSDYKKALEYNQKALAIREQVFGINHPDVALVYNNIGAVYSDMGNYKKALEYYTKALSIRERVLGTNHSITATTYNCLGMAYYDQGDYENALKHFRKALAIREQVLGPEHPSTATSYNNMALVYHKQGDFELAQVCYLKALAINKHAFGPHHPNTATTYDNLGSVYSNQGNYDKARENYGKALAIRERMFGTKHPSTATTYNNMAGMYKNQGEYEKALEYYQMALNVYLTTYGEEHPITKIIRKNLANLQYRMSK